MTSSTTTPTRTSKADKNLYSVSNNGVQLYAGTDRAVNLTPLPVGSFVDCTYINLLDKTESWDSLLKVCDGTVGLTFANIDARQGNENVIDCNARVRSCTFSGDFGQAGEVGDQVITTKGGCFGLTYAGKVFSKGRIADVVVGTWSDQSHDPSGNLDYSGLTRADNSPVRFVFGRVNSPWRAIIGKSKDIKLPPGAKVLFWRSLAEIAYWWGKFAVVKMGLMKGVKA